MVPLQILQRSFLILPPAKPEEYLLNPITLLGLRDHPFYFNAMALQQYLSQTEAPVNIPGSGPMFAYRVGEEEQAESKARRRQKRHARPEGWKDRYPRPRERSASPGPSSSGPAQPAQAEPAKAQPSSARSAQLSPKGLRSKKGSGPAQPAQAEPAQAQPAQIPRLSQHARDGMWLTIGRSWTLNAGNRSFPILDEKEMAEWCRSVEQDRVTCTESMWLSLAVRLCLLDQLTLPWYSRRVPQLRGIEKGSAEDRGKFFEKVASDSASRIEAAKVSEEWNREGRSPWGDRYARLYKKAQAQPKKAEPKKAQPKKAPAQPAQAQPAQAQPAQDRETWIQNNWANLKSGVKLRILSQSGVRPRL